MYNTRTNKIPRHFFRVFAFREPYDFIIYLLSFILYYIHVPLFTATFSIFQHGFLFSDNPHSKKKKGFDCARPLVIYDKLINSLSLCDAVMCYYRTLATPGRPVFLHTIDVHNRIDIIDHLGESRSNQTASIYTLYI